MLVILDYGMGNPGSMLNMFRRIGVNAEISSRAESIMAATAIVLPGVGAFDNGVDKLKAVGILDCLEQRVLRDKVPFLGVCLGMQLLFERSEEGALSGLAWIPGEVRRFDFSVTGRPSLKIPHMGWNVARPVQNNPLFHGLDREARFYFVHSYHATCTSEDGVSATTEYGYSFVSAVQRENIFGVQFHPEKSHRFGMRLLTNFAGLAAC